MWYRMRYRFLTHIVAYLAALFWRVWPLGRQVAAGISQAARSY